MDRKANPRKKRKPPMPDADALDGLCKAILKFLAATPKSRHSAQEIRDGIRANGADDADPGELSAAFAQLVGTDKIWQRAPDCYQHIGSRPPEQAATAVDTTSAPANRRRGHAGPGHGLSARETGWTRPRRTPKERSKDVPVGHITEPPPEPSEDAGAAAPVRLFSMGETVEARRALARELASRIATYASTQPEAFQAHLAPLREFVSWCAAAASKLVAALQPVVAAVQPHITALSRIVSAVQPIARKIVEVGQAFARELKLPPNATKAEVAEALEAWVIAGWQHELPSRLAAPTPGLRLVAALEQAGMNEWLPLAIKYQDDPGRVLRAMMALAGGGVGKRARVHFTTMMLVEAVAEAAALRAQTRGTLRWAALHAWGRFFLRAPDFGDRFAPADFLEVVDAWRDKKGRPKAGEPNPWPALVQLAIRIGCKLAWDSLAATWRGYARRTGWEQRRSEFLKSEV